MLVAIRTPTISFRGLSAMPTMTSLNTALSRSTRLFRSGFRSSFEPRRNFFKIIHAGTEGQRLFFGQNPQLMTPGIWLNIPLIHTVKVVDMRESSLWVSSLNAYTKDNVPVTISGSLFYRVFNSNKACFSVQEYMNAINSLGTSAARSIIGKNNLF